MGIATFSAVKDMVAQNILAIPAIIDNKPFIVCHREIFGVAIILNLLWILSPWR